MQINSSQFRFQILTAKDNEQKQRDMRMILALGSDGRVNHSRAY